MIEHDHFPGYRELRFRLGRIYVALRLSDKQRALWVGGLKRQPGGGEPFAVHQVFNVFRA